MASYGGRGWRGGGGRGGASFGSRGGAAGPPSRREFTEDPYSYPGEPIGRESVGQNDGEYDGGYGRGARSTTYPRGAQSTGYASRGAQSTGYPSMGAQSTAYPSRGAQSTAYPSRGAQSTAYPSRGAQSTPYPRGGARGALKRPVDHYEDVEAKKLKPSSFSEMNRLLEESQQEMASLKGSNVGKDYLSQVLEKQQKLIEMQSKMLSGAKPGAPSHESNMVSYPLPRKYQNYSKDQYDAYPPQGGEDAYADSGKFVAPAEANGRGRGVRGTGSRGTGNRGRGSRGRGTDSYYGTRSLMDAQPAGAARGSDLYDPFEEDPYTNHSRDPYADGARRTAPPAYSDGPRGPAPSKYAERARGAPPLADLRRAENTRTAPPYSEGPRRVARPPYADDPYMEDGYLPAPEEDPYLEGRIAPAYREPRDDPYLHRRPGPPIYEPEDPYHQPRDPYGYGDEYMEETPYERPTPPGGRGRGRGRGFPPPPRGGPPPPRGGPPYRPDARYPREQESSPEYMVSVEGKLNNFIKLLFDYEDPFYPVSAIETTRNRNTEVVKIRTDYQVIEDKNQSLPITGFLRINGILLDVQSGNDKFQVKDKVYAKALYLLLAKSVSEIFANSCKLIGGLPAALKEQVNPHSKKGHRFVSYRLKALINALRDELQETCDIGSEENIVYALDVASGNADAAITQVYYQDSPSAPVTCELYVDDLMLGSGTSPYKKSSYHAAYSNARDMLLGGYMPPVEIIKEGKNLQDLDMLDTSILEILYKAKDFHRGNNICAVKKNNPNTVAQDIVNKREVVVYEYGRRDQNNAYKTLEDTALTNRMLLEFAMYSKLGDEQYRCFIFLQGRLLAESFGYSRMEAKINAADKANTYLHDNSSIIEVSDRNYKNLTLDFIKAKSKATAMQTEKPELELKFQPASYKLAAPTDPQPNELTPWVDKVLEDMLDAYSKSEGLEEIIFGNNFPKYHVSKIQELCKKFLLNLLIKKNDPKEYKANCIVVMRDCIKNPDHPALVKMLRSNGSKSGRFKLIQWKDENDVILRCVFKN